MGLQQRRDVAVSASGLQIDSYLADAHFPVVCRSLPAPQLRWGHGATQPAFTCSVEVMLACKAHNVAAAHDVGHGMEETACRVAAGAVLRQNIASL